MRWQDGIFQEVSLPSYTDTAPTRLIHWLASFEAHATPVTVISLTLSNPLRFQFVISLPLRLLLKTLQSPSVLHLLFLLSSFTAFLFLFPLPLLSSISSSPILPLSHFSSIPPHVLFLLQFFPFFSYPSFPPSPPTFLFILILLLPSFLPLVFSYFVISPSSPAISFLLLFLLSSSSFLSLPHVSSILPHALFFPQFFPLLILLLSLLSSFTSSSANLPLLFYLFLLLPSFSCFSFLLSLLTFLWSPAPKGCAVNVW